MRKKNYVPIGSVSSGTMRTEDLIPSFVWELEYAVKQTGRRGYKRELNRINRAMEKDGYFESEDANFDLDWLFTSLEEFAPPYFYFGAHPADGANYGFWLDEFMDESFDGLKVSDLSEVPRNYRGEVLDVNDHGNMTLYVKNSRGFREIWSIV